MLSPLPSGLQHCCRLIGDFPFDVPYSGGWQLVFGKSAASQSMWIRSELIMGVPFGLGNLFLSILGCLSEVC